MVKDPFAYLKKKANQQKTKLQISSDGMSPVSFSYEYVKKRKLVIQDPYQNIENGGENLTSDDFYREKPRLIDNMNTFTLKCYKELNKRSDQDF